MKDPYIINDKIYMYRTAYSPMYQEYIGIIDVYPDEDGQLIIKGRLSDQGADEYILFREHELEQFCLKGQ